jgi:hypothetical protein
MPWRSSVPAAPVVSPVTRHPSPRSGVALIVTIIMLAVITFLAVAFLALSGREKGSVKTATNQATAKQAAEAALERVKVELIANMLATTNPANFGLLVSTNYINYAGFQPSPGDELTNINYTYANGTPISLNDSRRLLTNLLYSPRAPVFITNRLYANSNEFRYYLDLNRDGRHNVSGTWPTLSDDPANPYFNTNGFQMPNIIFGNTLSNSVQGDPEWIGGLDRPNQPHGPENRFLYRYAYAVVPTGKTLDVNYIHNQASAVLSGTMDANGRDFFRNQGVGAWEINLAAFLHDLNTNATYGWGGGMLGYSYDEVNGLFPANGNAFDDAAGIYRYRVNGNTAVYNYGGLESVVNLYGANGIAAFNNDWVDGYTDSPLLSTNNINKMPAHIYALDNDAPGRSWVGADHPFHLFSTQDFFDRNKIATPGAGLKFMDRLAILGTNASTYDQYTYYRLLEQLGTDSAPEDPDKLNLNYVNVGGIAASNFISWLDTTEIQARLGPSVNPATLFFTNVADRLLRSYTTEWLQADYANYTNTFKIDQPFGVTGIPVYVNGQMAYVPAVQRILQMAANIWDAKTNRYDSGGVYPTVFAPLTAISNSAVYITGYREVSFIDDLPSVPPLDLSLFPSNNLASLTNFQNNDINLIYGLPLVIGARKGLPNFNEYAMDTRFTLERKLELIKPSPGGQTAITQTNQLYTLNVSIECGAEFWNSYRTNYARPVNVMATNRVTIALKDSNYPLSVPTSRTVVSGGSANTTLAAPWPAWTEKEQDVSFVVPLRTNFAFFFPQTTGYWPGSANYVLVGNSTPPYEVDNRLLIPNWSLEITNRVQAIITDSTSRRIIDYVLLGDMTYRTNLLSMFGREATATGFAGVWATNAAGTQISGRPGVAEQILISMGNMTRFNSAPADWEYNYGTFPANRANEIAKFGAFFLPEGSAGSFTDPATGEIATSVNNSNRAYTPFNPSVTFTVPMSWQANDPLVHYIGRDMLDLKSSGIPFQIKPTGGSPTNAMQNIGMQNARYLPWGREPGALASDPDAFNPAIKDPLVRRSDDWQFPTNTLPTLGWLGRIHRGSPWQTIYLKSSNVGLTNLVFTPTAWALNANFKTAADKWAKWTGNRSLQEGFYSRPVMDRLLFDVFTTALNDNASRGRLPINQSGLAAWSALFSGMVMLTNDSPIVLAGSATAPQFSPLIIQPAGAFDAFDDTAWPAVVRLVNGINQTRSNLNFFPNGTFEHLGDILAVPELTDESPFLNRGNNYALYRGLTDAAYEWLPQQMLSLVQLGTPRFVVYSYGQALQPAPDSIVPSGTYAGLCTNYAITAEVALRAVVKVVGSPDPARTNSFLPMEKRYPPRAVVESFNYLGPE